MLQFDPGIYTDEECTVQGECVRFRAWRGILYVEKPVNPEFQQLNLFAPAAYYEGASINGYTLKTAPVFVPNTVGGYHPGPLDEPGEDKRHPGAANTIFRALQHGYVVAAPAIRGRTQVGGKAPACIVDYKAAVRWLHCFAADLPGDENKIITNGTSAGGALSALMGATGDHPDYEPYLSAIGAADASDAVFAASCYCPITNLDHADMAYEWQFLGVNDFHRRQMQMGEGGRPTFTPVDGELTPLMVKVSAEEAALFPAYVNNLALKDEIGAPLTMTPDGEGPFKSYIMQKIMDSARRAMDSGMDISAKSWLTVEDGRITAIDFSSYVRDITRMKEPPAFDALDLSTPENDLFGIDNGPGRHFTAYSQANSLSGGAVAEKEPVKLLNPMHYIGDPAAAVACNWRIRHGTSDRDTSLAISTILALKLREEGCQVNHHFPWDLPHSGDYDLDELFAWIDGICL